MIAQTATTIDIVSSLLAGDEGLKVCYDPPVDAATDGVFDSLPLGMHPELSDYLARRFPRGLFRHQRAAAQHLLAGLHTVVATRTSSGKSLIYSIPVFDRLLTAPTSTALFLFPQKALANDQLQKFTAAADDIPSLARLRTANPYLFARYDGATSKDDRPGIREQVQILLTNPDMLHYAILAYPTNWERFLSRLRYVVVDECHEYRGIFGTNVSYLFRRLRALCRQYGSSPTFIATSATVQSPQEHMERLTGLPFACVGPDEEQVGWFVGNHPGFARAAEQLGRLDANPEGGLWIVVPRSKDQSAELWLRWPHPQHVPIGPTTVSPEWRSRQVWVAPPERLARLLPSVRNDPAGVAGVRVAAKITSVPIVLAICYSTIKTGSLRSIRCVGGFQFIQTGRLGFVP